MRQYLVGSLVIGIGACLAGCPLKYIDVCDDGACDALDASGDSPADVVADVAGCDRTKELKDSPKCIDDAVGLFVSPTGLDTNAGTKASPLATLGKALALGGRERIYVCEGTYAGSVDVTKTVAIYGGLKCDWTPTGAHAVIQADKSAYAVQVTASNVSFVDIDVLAKGGAAAGESSIGLFANAATSLKLLRVKVSAGAGVTGTNGSTGSNYTTVSQGDASIKGKDASGIAGGGPKVCALCTDAKSSVGGGGGNGGAAPSDGSAGTPVLGGGAKGLADPDGVGVMTCTTGGLGTSPTAATPAPSPTTSGTLDGTGWKPSSGTAGVNGAPAQGGGGGGGGFDGSNAFGGGGGGGCGGCGGGLGTGGTGGGSSIALLSFSSTITLTASELVSTTAGNGGNGAAGQAGQLGGFNGTAASQGCAGGNGGTGGAGGSGSGGSGGLSVGILYKGTKPTTDAATDGKITFGTKGNKGVGGTPTVNDGVDGVAQAVLQIP